MCTNGVVSPTIGQCTNALALGQATGNCEAIPAITSGTITYSSSERFFIYFARLCALSHAKRFGGRF
uniref:Uncharacterized protein n=1 Tax=Caenorhabditis japonica TaxID=281687 RepID=A0A8R1EBX8_CAEJA